MLERTAASLESCNLQRVLPKPARSPKRCRQLQKGFWQHGASAIELSSAWHVSARASRSEPVEAASRPPQTGLVASTFLLDFLYPNATYKLLRRFYPGLPRPQDGNQTSDASRPRHFTSSAPTAEPGPQNPLIRPETTEPSNVRTSDCSLQNRQVRTIDEASSTTSSYSSEDKTKVDVSAESLNPEPHSHARTLPQSRFESNASLLTDLLLRPDEERHHDVWDLYCRLDEQHRAIFRRQMVLYLSKSHGIVEIGRAISLFRQVLVDQWDDDFLAAGVLVLMRSGDLDHAIDRLKAGMEAKGLTGGLEYILADTIANQKWPALISVWLEFHASQLKIKPDSRPDDICLERLENLPDVDRLFFSFERYLSTDGARPVRAINLYPASRIGLGLLRRKLAQLALMQPCQPKEAAAILETCADHQLYQNYLLRVLDRWNNQSELRSNMAWLSELYRTYREMPGAEPSIPLLQGMFNLHFPTGVAGLQEIYQDWHRTWGDLNQWGFEKFLKFYAGAGDVQAVRQLWERYVTSFPRVLKYPRAFRSTMNVYAQVGDAAKAEEELRIMTNKYGVEPDIDIWNTLLKCYMRTEDYDRVLTCFEEICKMHRPDSFTYAHAMAMCAKRGDLETTLDFFNRSQQDGVPVSKEIAMSLVMAYCRNDRLVEAEKICVELAERKATSTAIWNQLILFNGRQGKLNNCYELLQAMKNFDVAWDHQTHEFLLQALVRVDQIQPAYRLLLTAYKEKLFPVGPEHFAIVMAGAVRTGELKLVEIISSHLQRAGQAMNFNAQVALAEAAFERKPTAARTRQLGKGFVTHLRSMLAGQGKEQVAGSVSILPRDLRFLRKQTESIGRAIRLLVELRDFATAEELVNVYARIFPKYSGSGFFPPQAVSALMLGYLKDRRFSQVHKMWKQTWESVLAGSKRRQGLGVYPAFQYEVSRPISIVAKAFRQQNDGKGLLECVERVTSAGFNLTRSNWNLIIRYLAEMGQWEPAMGWCETMLMPSWRGWSPGKKSLQERRHLKNTRVLQASNAAVLSLQHQWLEIRKLAAWSADVSAKLRDIERRYPRLHYAFTTTDFEHLPGTWTVDKKSSLKKGTTEILKPFSHAELKTMQRSLEKQLRLRRDRNGRPASKSPPRPALGRAKKRVRVKTLKNKEPEASQPPLPPSEETIHGGNPRDQAVGSKQ